VRAVKIARMDLPAGPEQEALAAFENAFFDDKFGSGPAKVDAVGRIVEPTPIRPINETPVEARTPEGGPVAGAVGRIAREVADAADDDGAGPAVAGLQAGLNILNRLIGGDGARGRATGPTFNPDPGAPERQPLARIFVPELATDGVAGPKTRRALRLAAARFGAPKLAEGVALGRFETFARDIETGRASADELAPMAARVFGPLFRRVERAESDPETRLPRPEDPARPTPEGLALQATINDLGASALGRERFRPILEDGVIGPKTTAAFREVLAAAGHGRFPSRLGHNLGFFDLGDEV